LDKHMTLADNLAVLESIASELKAERNNGPLENDVYEEVDDICGLLRRAVAGDTRVNYPARAESEMIFLQRLRVIVSARTEKDRERYLPVLDRAEAVVRQIAVMPIPPDGHLGVLRLIRGHFDFLLDQYGFTVADEQPTGMHLTRGDVVIEVGWATQSSLSFSIRRGDLGDFWVDDLLYLHRDERYESVPQAINLNAEADIDVWFQFLSGVLRQYGEKLLRDTPGAFDRLAGAQSERDAEYAARKNAK